VTAGDVKVGFGSVVDAIKSLEQRVAAQQFRFGR